MLNVIREFIPKMPNYITKFIANESLKAINDIPNNASQNQILKVIRKFIPDKIDLQIITYANGMV